MMLHLVYQRLELQCQTSVATELQVWLQDKVDGLMPTKLLIMHIYIYAVDPKLHSTLDYAEKSVLTCSGVCPKKDKSSYPPLSLRMA